jgi:hypothetical protein
LGPPTPVGGAPLLKILRYLQNTRLTGEKNEKNQIYYRLIEKAAEKNWPAIS